MELLLIAIAALLTSGLTLFSGFGLGTILMPVFALFFPRRKRWRGTGSGRAAPPIRRR